MAREGKLVKLGQQMISAVWLAATTTSEHTQSLRFSHFQSNQAIHKLDRPPQDYEFDVARGAS
jgi:uncharacterized protein (DUF1778 family)